MKYFDFNEEKLRNAILKLRSCGFRQRDIAFDCNIDPANLSRFISGKSSFRGNTLFVLFNYVYNELFRLYGKIQDIE